MSKAATLLGAVLYILALPFLVYGFASVIPTECTETGKWLAEHSHSVTPGWAYAIQCEGVTLSQAINRFSFGLVGAE